MISVESSLFIAGSWRGGHGERFSTASPADGRPIWAGPAASTSDAGTAVAAAQAAFQEWSGRALAERELLLRRFAEALASARASLAATISDETGKPPWESAAEVQSMIDKIPLAVAAHGERCHEFRHDVAITRFRPHGVVAVLGPFNFPGHLPGGHIAPALLAGNTVVFKPSEHTPLTAQRTVELWQRAGLPAGVLNLLQGGSDVGAALAASPGVDGVFFTGSARAGIQLGRLLAEQPQRILALEMGGNNPLVVHQAGDARAAALLTVQSAYLTAGQRCTCARRLVVVEGDGADRFLEALVTCISRLRVGAPEDDPEPFMGPVISARTAAHLLQVQDELIGRGARPLATMKQLRADTGLVTPALLDVTEVAGRTDEEHFGPLLQLVRVPDLAAAVDEANRTRFGLAAGLLGDDEASYRFFFSGVRAGIVNWNRPLTGASSAAPFGGVGYSGNHRPSGYFAADYCSYPVASIELPRVAAPVRLPPGIE